MNSLTIAGRIGKDAETRTAGDTTATGFSVAVDEGYGDKKKTLWIDCTLWGSRGEKLAQYLTKGTQVVVTGSAGLRTWNSDKGAGAALTLRVLDVTLMGGGEKRDGHVSTRAQAPLGGFADLGDDVPFAPEWRG